MEKTRIVITEPEYRKAETVFGAAEDISFAVAAPDERSVVDTVRRHGAWGVILGVERYAGELYDVLPRGGIIARFGVGHDGVDKAKATAAGLCVTNTPGVLEDAVAEHALTLMLALAKQLVHFVGAMALGSWEPVQTFELRGKTLAVIGCGGIGRRVARIAHLGFGMNVVGMDVSTGSEQELREQWGVSRFTTDFAEAVADASFVSIHVPGTDSTRHIINRGSLACFPPASLLINTSRGIVVDESALYDALSTGAIAGAALDVFDREPYVPAEPAKDLRTLTNVLLTPHVGSATREACARVADTVVRNVRRACQGNLQELDLVNPDVLPALTAGAARMAG